MINISLMDNLWFIAAGAFGIENVDIKAV